MFIPIVMLIVTAVSNGANITDGLDGLTTGTSAIIGVTLGVFAYVSGNTFFAYYLNIMYIPDSGELVIFISAFVGACVGFLWYNSFPAQVFMGDTGSLPLGGLIGFVAIVIRQELMLFLVGGVFVIEALSVMLQVGYFKATDGKRLFRIAPIHHHFHLGGWTETQTVVRFWLLTAILAAFALASIKLR